ncbi:MAG: type II secretion system F family protein, partial [Planctomycetota bacterium]|nr:type II secretion system F family protein [Planctomycetota bacterium]
MPYFKYKALRASGEEVLGGLEAGSAEVAASTLREQGLFVVQVAESHRQPGAASAGKRRLIYRASWLLPIVARDRAMFFRQLSMMLQTGLTLLQGLEVCVRESNKRSF